MSQFIRKRRNLNANFAIWKKIVAISHANVAIWKKILAIPDLNVAISKQIVVILHNQMSQFHT